MAAELDDIHLDEKPNPDDKNPDPAEMDIDLGAEDFETRLMKTCSAIMAFLHPACAYSVYLVVPYFVLATPDKGWSSNDLGLFFSAISVGEIAGSQIVPLAASFDTNSALFIGHGVQIVATFIGYFCMSSIAFFSVWVFSAGMFLLGFGYGISAVQAYCTGIAGGDENLELDLMGMIGKIYIISSVTYAFAIPPIYDVFGYTAYCIVMMLLSLVMLLALIVLVLCFVRREYREQQELGSECDELSDVNDLSKQSTGQSLQLEETHIPILNIISPSMYMLLLLKAMQCFAYQVYVIAYSVAFSADFGITSQIGGALFAGSSMLGFVGLYFNGLIRSYLVKWQYPFDLILYFGLFALSMFVYVFFYAPWIAYTFHIFALGAIFTLSGIEMTTRLFLCPTQAFQQITGIVGILQAGTYLTGSVVAPVLMNVSKTFPFLAIGVIAMFVCVAMYVVYLFRTRFLNVRLNTSSSGSKTGYLTKERAMYGIIKKSAHRRGAMLSDKQITLLDDMEAKLNNLQKQFSSMRAAAMLTNPRAAMRLEQFANNAAINEEIRRATTTPKKDANFNPNAIIQLSDLAALQNEDADSNSDSRSISEFDEDEVPELKPPAQKSGASRASMVRASIVSASSSNSSRLSLLQYAKDPGAVSKTMEKQMKMRMSISAMPSSRKSITGNAAKRARKGGARSMARQSILRSCEPSFALADNDASAEDEAMRRAKALSRSRSSVFMMM